MSFEGTAHGGRARLIAEDRPDLPYTGAEGSYMPAKSRASPKRSRDPCAELKRRLKEREEELKEAREQQKAMSEILRIISSSPTISQPVFDAIVMNAARLFGGSEQLFHRGRFTSPRRERAIRFVAQNWHNVSRRRIEKRYKRLIVW